MKIKSLKGKGIGRFREEFSLPIDQLSLEDKIIAIVGANGAGKSTIIEAIPGVVFGSVPSHGPLAAMANAADSFVEAEIEVDEVYRLRRTINANRKNPVVEAYAFDANGKPLSDGKQGTFKKFVDDYFPSKEIYLASGFSSQQGDEQFLSISKSERKKLFTEMIGCGGLQRISEAAGDRTTQIQKSIAVLAVEERIFDVKSGDIDNHRYNLDSARDKLLEVLSELKNKEFDVKKYKIALDAWGVKDTELRDRENSVRFDLQTARDHHQNAEKELQAKKHELAKLNGEKAALTTRLAKKDELESTALELEGYEAELLIFESQKKGNEESWQKFNHANLEWRRERSDMEANFDAVRINYDHMIKNAERDARAAKDALDRVTKQVGQLSSVPCHGNGDYSVCPLLTTAKAAQGELETAEATHKKAALVVQITTADTKHLGETKKALESILASPPKQPENKHDANELDAKIGTLKNVIRESHEAKAKLAAMSEISRRLDTVSALIVGIVEENYCGGMALDDMAKNVGSVEGKLFSVSENREAHKSRRPAEVDESEISGIRRRQSEGSAEVGRYEEALARAEAATAQLEQVRKDKKELAVNLDDWLHLQKAFGADGIQALEIANASPEVSELINLLMHAGYGSRFTSRLETTALKVDGKGTKEIFDLFVIDSEQGREGSASDLSGGESVFAGEALSLAIAIFNTRRSSIPILDLFRDECSGALDAEKAPRYLAMLRKALELGGFNRLFFIAHQPDLWALADRVINVVDGQASIKE